MSKVAKGRARIDDRSSLVRSMRMRALHSDSMLELDGGVAQHVRSDFPVVLRKMAADYPIGDDCRFDGVTRL